MTETFFQLTNQPSQVTELQVHDLERFVMKTYDVEQDCNDVNEFRKEIFHRQKTKKMQRLPPASALLLQHILKAALQSGHMRSRSQESTPILPGFSDFGWVRGIDGKWLPKWLGSLPDHEPYEFVNIFCGLPQGTKLGPLSFLIDFNRILTTIRERFKFADDLTVLSLRLSPLTTEQPDLIKIYHDLKAELGKVKLTVSETKSSYMTFSFLKGNNHSSHNSILPTKKTVKILGILFDDDLRWNSHVDYLTKKCASLLQSFSNLKRFGTPTEVLKFVYRSYVRPSLEYACPAWHPGLTKYQTDRLETIQKRAVKIILGQNYSTYEDALKQLNLDSLDSRRHGLTHKFGLNCLNSPTHCRLLPNFVSPPQLKDQLLDSDK